MIINYIHITLLKQSLQILVIYSQYIFFIMDKVLKQQQNQTQDNYLSIRSNNLSISRSDPLKNNPYYVLQVVRRKKQLLKNINNLSKDSFQQKEQSSICIFPKISHSKNNGYSLPKIKTATVRTDLGGATQQQQKFQLSMKKSKTINDENSDSYIKINRKVKKRNHTHTFQQISEKEQLIQQLQNTQVFRNALAEIPKSSKQRNLQNMQKMTKLIKRINPFFRQCSLVLIAAFFKCSKIKMYKKGAKVYSINDKFDSIFIILWGRVKLTDISGQFKKISGHGQTLSQQILFSNPQKVRLQNVKSLSQSYLLQIHISLYRKLYEELVLCGLKKQFLAIQNLMKRNYLVKQSLKPLLTK